MAHAKNHDYHILHPSIWPLIGAVGAFVMLFGSVLWMHGSGPYMFLIGLVAVLYTMFAWWSEVVNESAVGDHTPVVRIGLRYGFILFIMSEVMFFLAWFWTFFKHAMYPMGPQSPAIHALVHENNRQDMKWGLTLAILLGVCFTGLQAYEYSHAAFGFSGNIYGASFFMATGFHGFHVLIGTLFLLVCLLRVYRGHFTQEKHVGFEAAAWYWHFVDVVWLFLFFAIYIWGR
jgi:cytochrome c oxidase subunit III